MTIADFLLARIAEDEADRVTRYRSGYLPTPRELSEAKRWEAECEAKRRIVERFENGTGYSELFAILAQPYADHPEFRPEWRLLIDLQTGR